MKRLALLLPLAFAACGEVDPYTGHYVNDAQSDLYGFPPGAPVALSTAQTASIQDRVRDELRDPASAVFGPMFAGQGQGGPLVVCGYVNAKNSFGGYTGDQIFVATIDGGAFTLHDVDYDPEFLDRGRGLMAGSCRFAGARI